MRIMGVVRALIAAATMLSACSPDSAFERSAVRDSAGVLIVETPAPAAEWRLSSQPVLQIGVVDGDDAYQFSSVAFAGRLSDGRVVVVDRQSYQIRFFDPAGKHMTTLGRRGAGPEEFRGFADVLLTQDTLLIYDSTNRRLVMIGPDATMVEERSVREHAAFPVIGLGHQIIGVTRDGRFVIVLPPAIKPPPVVNSFVYSRDTAAIVITTRTRESFDTVGIVASGEYLFENPSSSGVGPRGPRPGAGSWTRRGVTFGYYPYFALSSDGVVYASGERAGYKVLRFDRSASSNPTARIVRRADARPIPVSEVARRYVDWVGELVGSDAPGDAREAMAAARARLDALPRDHVVPFIDEMLADAEGRIWQRDRIMPWEPDDTPRTWTVYDREGHALARIVTPWNVRLTQIEADHVVVVTWDDADVPFVAVFRIVR